MKVHVLYVNNEEMQCRIKELSQCKQHDMKEVGDLT